MGLPVPQAGSLDRDEDLTPALIYWIGIAAIGLVAASGSSIVGWNYYHNLRMHYPSQAATYWPEVVRDQFLVVGLACNLVTGILATVGPIRSGIGLVAVLGGASCLSLFAIFNFVLRSGR